MDTDHNLIIAGFESCPFFLRAVQHAFKLLGKKRIKRVTVLAETDGEGLMEINERILGDIDPKALRWRTCPIVVFDGKLIGGYDDLVSKMPLRRARKRTSRRAMCRNCVHRLTSSVVA